MQFHKKVLPNGLRIIAVPMKDNKAVTVAVSVEAGSEYENKETNGISHFLEHVSFKGTKRRLTSKIIHTEFDSIGAESNAGTGSDSTVYYARARSKHLPKILDLISDIYINPTLPASEIEKEKGVVIEEINMYEDIPELKVYEILDNLLYGDQPAGFTIAGPKENIHKFSQKDLIEYRKNHYVASATVVSVAGNFNEIELFDLVEKNFANIQASSKQPKTKTKVSQERPAIKIHFKETDQTHLRLAFHSFDRYDDRRLSLNLLATILGAGMSSHLFHKMREELGLCYTISAKSTNNLDRGQFTISIGTSKDKSSEAIRVILSELQKMVAEPVDEKELQKAKEYRLGRLYLGLESSDDFAGWYGNQELYHLDILTPEQWAEKIKKVTPEDIQKVAAEIFRNDKMNLAVVGPFKDESEFLPILKI